MSTTSIGFCGAIWHAATVGVNANGFRPVLVNENKIGFEARIDDAKFREETQNASNVLREALGGNDGGTVKKRFADLACFSLSAGLQVNRWVGNIFGGGVIARLGAGVLGAAAGLVTFVGGLVVGAGFAVVEGLKYVGEKSWEGLKYVGEKSWEGLKYVGGGLENRCDQLKAFLKEWCEQRNAAKVDQFLEEAAKDPSALDKMRKKMDALINRQSSMNGSKDDKDPTVQKY